VERWCQMSEEMVAEVAPEHTFLRPSWFDQNFTELYFAPTVRRGFVVAPMGEGCAAWIDCRDIAAVAAVVLTEDGHVGKTYTLTGPAVINVREIVAVLSRAAGRAICYVDAPPGVQRLIVRFGGMPPRDVVAFGELIGELRAGRHATVTDDVERLLGRPAISIEKFAADHASTLRGRG